MLKPKTVFTKSQQEELERTFKVCPYPDKDHREVLARSIGLRESQVFYWFQNRRSRKKRRELPQCNYLIISKIMSSFKFIFAGRALEVGRTSQSFR
jgi:hypothetical protein